MENMNHTSSPARRKWSYFPIQEGKESKANTKVLTLKNLAALTIFDGIQEAEMENTGSGVSCDEEWNQVVQDLPLPPLLKREMGVKPFLTWIPISVPNTLEGMVMRALDLMIKRKWEAGSPIALPSEKDFLQLVPNLMLREIPRDHVLALRREKFYEVWQPEADRTEKEEDDSWQW